MTGARARGYRVNFIAVHWYGGDFSTGPAVQQLKSYLQAIHNQVSPAHLAHRVRPDPLRARRPTFPTQAHQAAFVTAATERRQPTLPAALRLVRAAASAGGGTAGLFNQGPSGDPEVGQAFEAARPTAS